MQRPAHILPVIVLAQLLGTSVWFAGNAVLPDLEAGWGIEGGVVWVTVATQVGFILGTLASALSGLADRVSPSRLFVMGAVLAGLFNAVPILWPESFGGVIAARLLVGVALAGIYPIGMKVAAGWFDGGLGGALGWLVGALVVGTALPHGIRALGADLPWQSVLGGTSLLCAAGGILLVVAVPDGPYLAKSAPFDIRAPLRLVRDPALRSAALGYLGHMWELYTFWALIPAILTASVVAGATLSGGVSAWSFATIAIGGVTCALGGMLARRVGSRTVAIVSLIVSGSCALVAPVLLLSAPGWIPALLVLWGATVIPDSPQLSALTVKAAPPELVGSALTLLNGSGFALTVVSLNVVAILPLTWALPVLALGPLVGVVALSGRRART